MKKILKSSIVIVGLLALISTNINASSSICWYCTRNKDHKQPRLDSRLDFVEKYDVYWIDRAHSSLEDEKVIYLTFDAGYENGNVGKIVDALKSEGVKATFFVLENILYKNKDLIQKMIDDGHIIANHTAKHRDMSTVSSKKEFEVEMQTLEKIFYSEYGENMPKFFRPPEGKFNEQTLKWAQELGYKTVMWSFAYADWDNGRQMSQEKAKEKILSNIHNGEVMLLHPTSATNAEIIVDVIRELKNQGFRFATVEELCGNASI